jgi:hypothetical protein
VLWLDVAEDERFERQSVGVYCCYYYYYYYYGYDGVDGFDADDEGM